MNTNSFRQLFIDNFIIERSINISKSLHSTESKGPVLTGDKNFQQKGVQTRNVELLDIFRGIMPFLAIVIFAMVLMYLFPGIALWLPDVLFAN